MTCAVRGNLQMPIANLPPPELEGFTIAHVSDLHSGLFVGPARLKIISDMTNDLKADLLAIPGDIINREMDEFPSALDAIRRIESRYGTLPSSEGQSRHHPRTLRARGGVRGERAAECSSIPARPSRFAAADFSSAGCPG